MIAKDWSHVDQTMVVIWEIEGDGTMCSLICLLYAGALFVAENVQKGEVITEDKNEKEILSTESQLEGDYFEKGEWESDSWEDL